MFRLLYICLLPILLSGFKTGPTVYHVDSGRIYFKSDAPLELIEASSEALKGLIDIEKRTFAFSLDVKTFNGFNNPLQKVHFHENYLESSQYHLASFSGKIIEKFDLSQEGIYTIRAKGNLIIHGISQERIIKSKIKVSDGKLYLNSYFTIFLKEHDINIPKIVHQKIAEEIQVSVNAALTKE